jgi:hypothetical protein
VVTAVCKSTGLVIDEDKEKKMQQVVDLLEVQDSPVRNGETRRPFFKKNPVSVDWRHILEESLSDDILTAVIALWESLDDSCRLFSTTTLETFLLAGGFLPGKGDRVKFSKHAITKALRVKDKTKDLLIAVHHQCSPGGHYSLLKVKVAERKILHMNSLPLLVDSRGEGFRSVVLQTFTKALRGDWDFEEVACARQVSNNCAPHTLLNMLTCLPIESYVAVKARAFLDIKEEMWNLEQWSTGDKAVDARCFIGLCYSEAVFAEIGNQSLEFRNVPFVGLPNSAADCWLAATVQAFAVQHGGSFNHLIRDSPPHGIPKLTLEERVVDIFLRAVRGVTSRSEPHIKSWYTARDQIPKILRRLKKVDVEAHQSNDEAKVLIVNMVVKVAKECDIVKNSLLPMMTVTEIACLTCEIKSQNVIREASARVVVKKSTDITTLLEPEVEQLDYWKGHRKSPCSSFGKLARKHYYFKVQDASKWLVLDLTQAPSSEAANVDTPTRLQKDGHWYELRFLVFHIAFNNVLGHYYAVARICGNFFKLNDASISLLGSEMSKPLEGNLVSVGYEKVTNKSSAGISDNIATPKDVASPDVKVEVPAPECVSVTTPVRSTTPPKGVFRRLAFAMPASVGATSPTHSATRTRALSQQPLRGKKKGKKVDMEKEEEYGAPEVLRTWEAIRDGGSISARPFRKGRPLRLAPKHELV